MAITSTSTSITTADSAVSSQSVVVNTGSGLTSYAGGGGAETIGAGGPVITNVIYTDASFVDTSANAANITGGNIKVIGTGFETGSNLYLSGNLISPSTFVSSTEYRATLPATAVGVYTFNLFAPSNVGSIWTTGIQFQVPPIWANYSTIATTTTVSYQLSASDATSYAVTGGSLPSGLSLSSGGLLSGTYLGVSGITTFTVTATNAYGQTTSQVVSFQYSPTYTVSYLVVAGGGSGGIDGYGGGGGGGGMLSGNATINAGIQYTITVGAGGAAQTTYTTNNAGFSSNMSGPAPSGFSAITTVGGGGGAGNGMGYAGVQTPGGSGGGGGYGNDTGGTGTPGQGFPGGNRYPSWWSGGGGGAGGAGNPGSPATGGDGGNGKVWPLTQVYYAAGGGGAASVSTPPSTQYGGVGGQGGGGSGVGRNNPSFPAAATPGAVNTGSGGGGGAGASGLGKGGSGVIILAVPNAAYPGTIASGATASTPEFAPGMTVLKYTSSGTFTG